MMRYRSFYLGGTEVKKTEHLPLRSVSAFGKSYPIDGGPHTDLMLNEPAGYRGSVRQRSQRRARKG